MPTKDLDHLVGQLFAGHYLIQEVISQGGVAAAASLIEIANFNDGNRGDLPEAQLETARHVKSSMRFDASPKVLLYGYLPPKCLPDKRPAAEDWEALRDHRRLVDLAQRQHDLKAAAHWQEMIAQLSRRHKENKDDRGSKRDLSE